MYSTIYSTLLYSVTPGTTPPSPQWITMDPLAVLTNDPRSTFTRICAFHWQLLATSRATMMPSACGGVALDFPSSGGSGVMNAVDLLILLTHSLSNIQTCPSTTSATTTPSSLPQSPSGDDGCSRYPGKSPTQPKTCWPPPQLQLQPQLQLHLSHA